MRIKINFKKTTESIPVRRFNYLNKEINGFVNMLLGNNNEYHGKFSRYSVSPMLGYVFNRADKTIEFPSGAYINISTDDDVFMNRIVAGLLKIKSEVKVGHLYLNRDNMFNVSDFQIGRYFDIIRTTGPVIVKDGSEAVTFKSDEERFLKILRNKSVKKLVHNGIDEETAETLKFQLFHPENAREEVWEIGKQKNIVSRVMLVVKGNKTVREKLYNLGLGVSTGFGFGSVDIIRKQL